MKKLIALSILSFCPALSASQPNCKLTLNATDNMQYQVDGKQVASLDIPLECEKFTITLKHVGKLPSNIMGHNFVLTETKDASTMSTELLKAGATTKDQNKKYIPDLTQQPYKTKVIAASKRMIGGGGSEDISFETKKLDSKKQYTFFCSFPGHFGMMKGTLNLVAKPSVIKTEAKTPPSPEPAEIKKAPKK